MDRIKIVSAGLITALLLITVTLSACTTDDFSKYTRFLFKEDDIRFTRGGVDIGYPLFTFEYPQPLRYLLPNPELLPAEGVIVSFAHDRSNSDIYIEAMKPNPRANILNADSIIENTFTIQRQPGDKFEVMDRSVINIGGQEAEFLTYSYDMNTETLKEVILRVVAFDYQGYVWKIQLFCKQEHYETMAPGFQHLLDTFEFLAPYPEGLKQPPTTLSSQ